MNRRNIATSISLGSEDMRVVTNLLIDGTAFMLFSGLNSLAFLKDLKFILLYDRNKAKISIILNVNGKYLPSYYN